MNEKRQATIEMRYKNNTKREKCMNEFTKT